MERDLIPLSKMEWGETGLFRPAPSEQVIPLSNLYRACGASDNIPELVQLVGGGN